MTCRKCFAPKLNDVEINLLLNTLESVSFPIEGKLHPATTTHAHAARVKKKLLAMLEHEETEFV